MPRLVPAFEQFFDGSGNPLVNGLLDFFESGSSSVRKTTYADQGETILNANPVVLGADGRAPDIFGTGNFRSVLRTAAGVQILTRDPVGGDQVSQFGADWVSTVVYSETEVVRDAGAYWVSQTNNNLGNRPSTDDGTNWELVILSELDNIALSGVVFDLISDLRDNVLASNTLATIKGHTTINDGGGGEFVYTTGAAPGTYVDNNGTIIVPTGGDGSAAWLRVYSTLSVGMFGSVGASGTDDSTAFQDAVDALPAAGGEILIPGGDYSSLVTASVSIGAKGVVWHALDITDIASGLEGTLIRQSDSALQYERAPQDSHLYEINGGIFSEMSRGNVGTEDTSGKPVFYIEKWTARDDYPNWDQGAATFYTRKTGGTSSVSCLTASARRTGSGTTQTGATVGLHGRAFAGSPIGGVNSTGAWSGWFYTTLEPAATGPGVGFGIEVNVRNDVGDAGHWEDGNASVTAPLTCGAWFFPDDAVIGADNHITAAVGIHAGSNAKWHSGIFVRANSIVPIDGVKNEAVFIEGALLVGNRYGGIRLTNYLHYGIDMLNATITNNSAIKLADNHQVQFGTANDSSIKFNGADLNIKSNTSDIQLECTNVDFKTDTSGSAGSTATYIVIKVNGTQYKLAALNL